MKVVLLAGGFGTRISEESHLKPKPMIEIGGKPIIWHIMKTYAHYGFNEFIICGGYKQDYIKDWFASYALWNSDVTFDFTKTESKVTIHNNACDPFKVTILDTGLYTMTGGRIKRTKDYVGDEPFFLTYGDGVSDVDIPATLEFHKQHGKLVTMTAVKPAGRFGVLDIEGNSVRSFREKSKSDTGWINGGYMVVDPKALDYIEGDSTVFEREPLEHIAEDGELACYKHCGFWQCMDTLNDKEKLEKLIIKREAPWMIWEK